MDTYDVVSTPNGWRLHAQHSDETLLAAPTKEQLLKLLPGYMDGRTGSVKIHTETGQIEDERTYPRSEDPAVVKGNLEGLIGRRMPLDVPESPVPLPVSTSDWDGPPDN